MYEFLETVFPGECCVIHSNKTQNYRLRSIRQFEEGANRILIATDVMARGLDIEGVSQVINMDTPSYPENYMHRIGRTGRAEKKGTAIILTTPTEQEHLEAIEKLMKMQVPQEPLPESVEISTELIPEERPKIYERNNPHKQRN